MDWFYSFTAGLQTTKLRICELLGQNYCALHCEKDECFGDEILMFIPSETQKLGSRWTLEGDQAVKRDSHYSQKLNQLLQTRVLALRDSVGYPGNEFWKQQCRKLCSRHCDQNTWQKHPNAGEVYFASWFWGIPMPQKRKGVVEGIRGSMAVGALDSTRHRMYRPKKRICSQTTKGCNPQGLPFSKPFLLA